MKGLSKQVQVARLLSSVALSRQLEQSYCTAKRTTARASDNYD